MFEHARMNYCTMLIRYAPKISSKLYQQSVLKEIFDLQKDQIILEVVLRYVKMELGGLFVMMDLTILMPVWFADNLDFQVQVSTCILYFVSSVYNIIALITYTATSACTKIFFSAVNKVYNTK